MATVKAKGENAELEFNFINIHLKAFPDDKSRKKRAENIEQLAEWIESNSLDDRVCPYRLLFSPGRAESISFFKSGEQKNLSNRCRKDRMV